MPSGFSSPGQFTGRVVYFFFGNDLKFARDAKIMVITVQLCGIFYNLYLEAPNLTDLVLFIDLHLDLSWLRSLLCHYKSHVFT